MDQPPATEKDFGADSVITAKENPTQPRKVVANQEPPPITYSESAQQIKTDQIPAQRLKTENEGTHQIQEEQPWGASEWGQMVGGQITIVGAHQCQCIGDQTCQKRKQKAVTTKGGNRHKHGQA